MRLQIGGVDGNCRYIHRGAKAYWCHLIALNDGIGRGFEFINSEMKATNGTASRYGEAKADR